MTGGSGRVHTFLSRSSKVKFEDEFELAAIYSHTMGTYLRPFGHSMPFILSPEMDELEILGSRSSNVKD